jgi:hypothetical protein
MEACAWLQLYNGVAYHGTVTVGVCAWPMCQFQPPACVVQASEFWLRHALRGGGRLPVLGVDVGRMKTGLALLQVDTGVCRDLGVVTVGAGTVRGAVFLPGVSCLHVAWLVSHLLHTNVGPGDVVMMTKVLNAFKLSQCFGMVRWHCWGLPTSRLPSTICLICLSHRSC